MKITGPSEWGTTCFAHTHTKCSTPQIETTCSILWTWRWSVFRETHTPSFLWTYEFFLFTGWYMLISCWPIVDLVIYIYTPEKLYPIVSPYISPLHHVLWNELHSSMLVKLDKQRLSCCLNHEGFPMLCSFNVRYFRYLNPWWIVPENSACCNQETSVRFLFMTSPFLLVGGPHRFYQTRFAGKSAI